MSASLRNKTVRIICASLFDNGTYHTITHMQSYSSIYQDSHRLEKYLNLESFFEHTKN